MIVGFFIIISVQITVMGIIIGNHIDKLEKRVIKAIKEQL